MKIAHIMLFLSMLSVFFTVSCSMSNNMESPVAPTGMKMNFRINYQNQPFIINKKYQVNGHTTMFTRLDFFISNIQLLSLQGDTLVQEVALLDFTSLDDSAKASAGVTVDLGKIPQKSYSGIRFGVGVAPSLNVRRPMDYAASSPLADVSYYWDGWKSYIFSKLEGKLDTAGSGTLDTGITLHTGGDTIYKAVTINKAFQPGALDAQTLALNIDFAQIIKDLDFTVVNSTHNKGDLLTMQKMLNAIANSIDVKK